MKNSSKNNYSEKNSNKYKKNSNYDFYSKDGKNSSKKNDRFSKFSDKSVNEIDKNKRNFSSSQSRHSKTNFINKGSDIYQELANK